MSATHPVRVGCSGWQYRDWRGVLYPDGLAQARWLERYGEVFDTVEVNSTFYRLASKNAVERWVRQTPPDFVFALKASRYLIHMKKLRDIEDGIGRFYERIRPLTGTPKMGPVLWQLPEWFTRDDDTLAATLEALPPGRHCFEFRDPSWFCDEVYALLRRPGVALAIGDHPERPWQPFELTADWTYVRFHGPAALEHKYHGRYTGRRLRRPAERLAAWLDEGVDVYAYFNNDFDGDAVLDAQWLRARLGGAAPSTT